MNSDGYIYTLAHATNTNLSGWDLASIFGDGNGGMITDKNEINKRFFEAREKGAPPQPVMPEPSVSDKIGKAIAKRYDDAKKKTLAEIKAKTYDTQKSIDSYYAHITTLFGELRKFQHQILKLDGVSTEEITQNFLAEIQEAINSGKWTDAVIVGDIIYIAISTNVMLEGINFGRFAVNINTANMDVRVSPFKDNICLLDAYRRYYHPSIYYSGAIPLNDSSRFAENIKQFKISKALDEIHEMLTTYQPNKFYYYCRPRNFAQDQPLDYKAYDKSFLHPLVFQSA